MELTVNWIFDTCTCGIYGFAMDVKRGGMFNGPTLAFGAQVASSSVAPQADIKPEVAAGRGSGAGVAPAPQACCTSGALVAVRVLPVLWDTFGVASVLGGVSAACVVVFLLAQCWMCCLLCHFSPSLDATVERAPSGAAHATAAHAASLPEHGRDPRACKYADSPVRCPARRLSGAAACCPAWQPVRHGHRGARVDARTNGCRSGGSTATRPDGSGPRTSKQCWPQVLLSVRHEGRTARRLLRGLRQQTGLKHEASAAPSYCLHRQPGAPRHDNGHWVEIAPNG